MRLNAWLATLACLALTQPIEGDEKKPDPKSEVFSIEGQFSIDTPPGGFKWSEFRKVEAGGVKGRVCICTKQASTSRVVLTVEERTAKDGQARIGSLKGHYNGVFQSLQSMGFTELKGTKPDLVPPIKDRVSFVIAGKDAQGNPSVIQSMTVFGKNIYLFQVFANSKEEADRLAKISETLKEPK